MRKLTEKELSLVKDNITFDYSKAEYILNANANEELKELFNLFLKQTSEIAKENKWNDNIELSKEREYELFKEEIEKGISEGKYSEEEIIRLNNWLDSKKPQQNINILDDGDELVYVPGHDEAIPLKELTEEELKQYKESYKLDKPEQK